MSGISGGPSLAPSLSEREKLRAALDGYNATDIGAMLEALSPGAGANRRKAERIEVLLRLLLDPAFAQRALATIGPLGRRLLGVARRTGRTSVAALLLAGQDAAHDERAVRKELKTLVNRALLLIENRAPNGGKVTIDLADPSAANLQVWVPQHLLDSLGGLGDDALPPVPAPPAAPAAVESGSFAILRRDLYLALRFLKGAGLRLTRSGEPHRADLRKLQAALQPGQAPARREAASAQLEGRVAFLLRLLGAAGLTAEDDTTLRAAEGAEAFLNQSEQEAARALFAAWLELDWNEFRRIPTLAIDQWSSYSYGYREGSDVPEGTRIAEAREAVAALLASAPAGWVGVAALAERLRQTDPEFLIVRVPEQPPSYYSYYSSYGYDTYYGNRQAQEQSYYRGFARAEARNKDRRLRKDQDWAEVEGAFVAQVIGESLRWLGLVDVGYDRAGPPGAEPPTAARLTELGRRVLGAAEAPAEQATDGAALVVQPNFEVLVLDALAHLDLIARLDAFADAQSLDRAAVYRLTRPAIVRGLAAGWTEERIVGLLEGAAATGLPQNVRHTLGDWVREYERVHIHRDASILEAPDAATLDAWLADPSLASALLRRLTPTVALVRPAEAVPLATQLEGRGVEVWSINYALDPPQVLDLKGAGVIQIAPEDDDPYLRYRLDRFADRQGTNERGWVVYHLTRASLRRAKERGQSIDELLSFLGYKTRTGLSPDDVLTLRGWSGYYDPFRWAPVRAVELPPTVSWGDLTRIKALRPLVLRVLNASLALIAEEQWPQLEAALTARGIALEGGLGVQPQAEKQGAAQRAAATPGVATGRQLAEGQAGARPPGKGRAPALQRLAGRQLADFIESAIDNEQALTIEYQKPNEARATVRTIDPHQLEVRGGAYYLHAFCHTRQEERVFRLAHVTGVALAEE